MKSLWGIVHEDVARREMRTRWGYSAYHMRRWLRLLRCSRSLLSYSLPMPILSPGGINSNTSDFNIRDSIWDPSFPHHSAISNDLMIIADSFNLDLSIPTHCVPTRYLDMASDSHSVIDLIFIQSGLTELNNHSIHPDWRLFSDHAPLTVSIPIAEENIVSSKFSIAKNSEEEGCLICYQEHWYLWLIWSLPTWRHY